MRAARRTVAILVVMAVFAVMTMRYQAKAMTRSLAPRATVSEPEPAPAATAIPLPPSSTEAPPSSMAASSAEGGG